MKIRNVMRTAVVCLALGVGTAAAAAAQAATQVADTARAGATATLADVVAEADGFSTLRRAIEAAGLTETLRGAGPFTIMAPTDEAFARLPPAVREALFADPARLRQVILYHIVPGQVLAAEARTLERAPTAQGSEIRIRRVGDQLRMNEATVRITDIMASNGVIHGIDRVLMPPETVRK